jgi:GT2 family glycosyltransferase
MEQTFAAFIMTYERPQMVCDTVKSLLKQSNPPQKVLVVDNSQSNDTELIFNEFTDPRVIYHRMGFNAGPAGAAAVGLSKLSSEGYDWIFWGDDDDPPPFNNSLEEIFQILKKVDAVEIGIIGKLGGKLNRLTGRTLNFQNSELNGVVEADYIPGNKLMIVNGNVIRAGVLPTEKLFFGFEELDFCLKVKNKGFKILFDGSAILTRRIADGHTQGSYRWRGKSLGDNSKLWRQYYSTRNMLYILKSNGLWPALIFNLLRVIVKMLYSFRFGRAYGVKHMRLQQLALKHFFTRQFGKADLSNILK